MTDNIRSKIAAWVDSEYGSCPVAGTQLLAFIDSQQTKIAALKAERDAAMKDAERLDYLQKHARCDPKMDGKHVWWPTTFNQAQNLRGETLREAIDAAIAKAEGKS